MRPENSPQLNPGFGCQGAANKHRLAYTYTESDTMRNKMVDLDCWIDYRYLCRTSVGGVGEQGGCGGNWWNSMNGKMVGRIVYGIPNRVGSWLLEHAQGWISLHIHGRHMQMEERVGVPRGD